MISLIGGGGEGKQDHRYREQVGSYQRWGWGWEKQMKGVKG